MDNERGAKYRQQYEKEDPSRVSHLTVVECRKGSESIRTTLENDSRVVNKSCAMVLSLAPIHSVSILVVYLKRKL